MFSCSTSTNNVSSQQNDCVYQFESKHVLISSDLLKTTSTLSEEALLYILDTGKIGFGFMEKNWQESDDDAPQVIELVNNGIITLSESGDETYPIQYNLTYRGTEIYQSITKTIINVYTKD